MHISLSEIETKVCKATEAVGLSPGLGEDAGRAARCMMASGVRALVAFVDALDAIDQGRSTGFDTDCASTGDFGPKPAGLTLSSLRAGPSACDLVLSSTNKTLCYGPITLNDIDVPIVVLFEALVASADLDKGQCIAWTVGGGGVFEGVCWRGSLAMINGASEDLLVTEPSKITMHLSTWEPKALTITLDEHLQRNAVEIDETIWCRIIGYADRLLVKGTEASRLTGAGSGVVVDTD